MTNNTVDEARRDPDALLAAAGVDGNPRRDQHFLVDDRILDRLPGYLPETADRTHILEIGAGTGALTDRLLAAGDRVTAIERDPTLAAFLREEFAPAIEADQLTVIEGDALETAIPEFTASVSNLPYGVASEIIFRLLPRQKPLVVTVQYEFAERMTAAPETEAYGRLSVSTNHYATAEIVEPVPPEAFSPPPAVDSAVVRLTPRDPAYHIDDTEFFLRFVKAIFTQRRKTLRNAIRNTAHISQLADPEAVVAATDESLLRQRPDALTPAEFANLATTAIEYRDD